MCTTKILQKRLRSTLEAKKRSRNVGVGKSKVLCKKKGRMSLKSRKPAAKDV